MELLSETLMNDTDGDDTIKFHVKKKGELFLLIFIAGLALHWGASII